MNNTDLATVLAEAFGREARHVAELVQGSTAAQFANSLKVTGARPLQLGAAAAATSPGAQLSNGRGRLLGWSLRAVGQDVTVTLHDSRDASGDVIGTDVIPAGTSANRSLAGGAGVSYAEGLYIETSPGGALVGTVMVRAAD